MTLVRLYFFLTLENLSSSSKLFPPVFYLNIFLNSSLASSTLLKGVL